ncbi:MAG: NADH-quinone oxidoreductase subunit C [Ruminococcus sp.]|jgi:ech hydrogenase subunit D|nr:NADH-quinone oxidoreductase subunit C [Ruminococcus sp.]
MNLLKTEITELLDETDRMKKEGQRLIAISAASVDDKTELSYSFDKDGENTTLRLSLDKDTEIPSITTLYPYAFLYENEIKELFKANVTGINLDFGGTLYKVTEKGAFA